LKDEVGAAEARVSRYRANLAEAGDASTDQLRAELEALNAGIVQVATERAGAEIRYRNIRAAIDDPRGETSSTALQKSIAIAKAREREQELAADRAGLAALVAPGNERLVQMDARLAAVRAEVAAEEQRIALTLYNELAVKAEEERRLREKAQVLQASLSAQDQAEADLREYEREAAASRIIHDTFLARLKETTQQEKLHEADAVVISAAEMPRGADSASSKRLAALGMVMGLMGGLAFAVVVDRLNNTFRALEDVEETTGLTVLGTIPLLDNPEEHGGIMAYVLSRPNSALAESIRSLRTSLLFSHIDQPPQVVMFTSSVPGEGKSTTSLLLALTSAQMGKSTIIVDCDLRRPTLSGLLGSAGGARGGLRAVL
ncbi:MAG: hypothetical protein AAFW98_19165, partial [Pseudomonadota bacterium]